MIFSDVNIIKSGITVTMYGIVRPVIKYEYTLSLSLKLILLIAKDAIALINTMKKSETIATMIVFLI
jgi:hypothetical protein